MSRENVELLRKAWETMLRRDASGLDYLDRDIQIEASSEIGCRNATNRCEFLCRRGEVTTLEGRLKTFWKSLEVLGGEHEKVGFDRGPVGI